ncbi:hypothetical protein L1987_08737 [Smallanthus sonchifolius]|uniref:Uncharacterized protein n=1 Tax=Smallanthus sonchifolius TaxID=185202 RepID=A0ACB9JNF5_9ASTR|nr:hypothetical protein L1987_08737 [Smallanthus sonchifolius]
MLPMSSNPLLYAIFVFVILGDLIEESSFCFECVSSFCRKLSVTLGMDSQLQRFIFKAQGSYLQQLWSLADKAIRSRFVGQQQTLRSAAFVLREFCSHQSLFLQSP